MTTGGLFGLVAMHMLYRAHFWKGRGQGETSISTHTMGQWYNATMGQRDRWSGALDSRSGDNAHFPKSGLGSSLLIRTSLLMRTHLQEHCCAVAFHGTHCRHSSRQSPSAAHQIPFVAPRLI